MIDLLVGLLTVSPKDSVRRSGQRLALDPRLDISPPPPGSVELSCESDLTQRGSESPPSLPPSYRSHQVVKQVSSRPAKTPTKSQSLSRMSSRKRDDKGAQRRASASPTPSPKQQTYPSTAFTAPRVTSTSPEREGGRTAASTSQAPPAMPAQTCLVRVTLVGPDCYGS